MKTKVALFFGGKSVEHEISVISAIQAMAALSPEKYEVIPVYITKNQMMYTGERLKKIDAFEDIDGLLQSCRQVYLLKTREKVILMGHPAKRFGSSEISAIDVAFPVVHGTHVEDGCLQGFFETFDLPYVGSDVSASAAGMDKWTMKCLLQGAQLPVLSGYTFQRQLFDADPEGEMDRVEEKVAYPLIVKPVNLGSSVGISPALNREELKEAIELAAAFSERILLEPLVENLREINCAVLGDWEQTWVSACEEPLRGSRILSYTDKYQGGNSKAGNGAKGMSGAQRVVPALLEEATQKTIETLAQKAFLSLNCRGVARVDFLIDENNGQIYINELNTIPGSLSFYLWEKSGLSFEALNDRLIQLALKHHRQKKALIWTHNINILKNFKSQGSKGSKIQ